MTAVELARRAFSNAAPNLVALIEERSGPPTSVVAAARRGDSNALTELLKRQGSPTDLDRGRSALHYAVGSRRVEAVRVLLEHGADVNATDERGWTPLHHAAFQEDEEIVQCLVDAGAERDLRETMRQMTALDMAREKNLPGIVAILS